MRRSTVLLDTVLRAARWPPSKGPWTARTTDTVRRRDRLLIHWLPVALWAGLIFALSSIPDLGTGLGGWDLALRKIAHALEYAVLGLLLLRAVGREAAAAALGIGYAVTDEIHQTFVAGRQGSARDVLVDAVGVLAGVYLFPRLVRRIAA